MSISKALKDEIIRSKQTRYAIAVGAGVDHAVLRRFLSGERDFIKSRDLDHHVRLCPHHIGTYRANPDNHIIAVDTRGAKVNEELF